MPPLPLPLTGTCGMRSKRTVISGSKVVLRVRPYFGIALSMAWTYFYSMSTIGAMVSPMLLATILFVVGELVLLYMHAAIVAVIMVA